MDKDLQYHIDETIKHKTNVLNYLLFAGKILNLKGRKHDNSKLRDPEQSIFVEYTPKLKNSTYGSDEYKQFLKEMKPALDHHYSHNSHHPEYYKNGIEDMNLFDIIEMFFDWMAASKRHDNGNIYKSIEINKTRFGYDDLFADILKNTVDYINNNWNYDIVEKQFLETDSNDVRQIVYDWLTGICVSSDEYKKKYSDEENRKAYEIIMTLISMGLG